MENGKAVKNKMKIKNKPIESVRIRRDRAEKLKTKSFELSMEIGEIVSEADLINFLIDEKLEEVEVLDNELIIES